MKDTKPGLVGSLGRAGTVQGMLWMVLATLSFVSFTVIARFISTDLNPIQTAFLRYAFGMMLLLPFMMRAGAVPGRSRNLRLHIARGVLHGIGVMLWFYAMTRISIAEITALGFTSPVFATIGAVLFLGEKLRWRRVGALMVGFAGAMVILRPGFATIDSGAMVMLIAAPLFAGSKLIAKALTRREANTRIIAHLSLIVTLVMALPALYVWEAPTVEQLAWIFVIACIATGSHFCMVQAYRSADLTLTQPIEFLQLLWAALAGVVFFDEFPVLWVWIGGAMIIASAGYIAHREATAKASPVPAEGKKPRL